MAGSYNHIITNRGNLVSNERFTGMIENLGDAYETVEEMYGMIWWLAHAGYSQIQDVNPASAVELARQNYAAGLELAKSTKNKRGPDGG